MQIPEKYRLPAAFQDRPQPDDTDARAARKRYILNGAVIGFATGLVARVWMRTVNEQELILTIPGTAIILLVFSALGAAAGLAFAWRRLRSRRRLLIQRGVALAPLLAMGPFIPFFGPSALGAAVVGHRSWSRWLRWPMLAVGILIGGFFILASLSRGPVGVGAALLYLPLSYMMFLACRIAFEPRPARGGAETPAPSHRDAFEPWLA